MEEGQVRPAADVAVAGLLFGSTARRAPNDSPSAGATSSKSTGYEV